MIKLIGDLVGGQIFDTIVKILLTLAIGGILIGFLPESPFTQIIASIGEIPYIGYINWVFPVGKCLAILYAWGVAIIAYYAISWILRQLDIIGD